MKPPDDIPDTEIAFLSILRLLLCITHSSRSLLNELVQSMPARAGTAINNSHVIKIVWIAPLEFIRLSRFLVLIATILSQHVPRPSRGRAECTDVIVEAGADQ